MSTSTSREPKQGRSGNPAKRAAQDVESAAEKERRKAQKTAVRADDATKAAPAKFTRFALAKRLFLAALAALAMTTSVLMTAIAANSEVLAFATYLIPMAITLLAIPQTRHHGLHRWAIVWLLTYIVIPETQATVLLLGGGWIYHRFWTVEYPPGTRDTGAFRLTRPRLPSLRKVGSP